MSAITKLTCQTILFSSMVVAAATMPVWAAQTTNRTGAANDQQGQSQSGQAGQQGGMASWDNESTYWRDNYTSRPYYRQGSSFDQYEPAYRYGMDTYNRNQGTRFEDLDTNELREGWMQNRQNSSMNWTQAEDAVRDSYERMYNNRASAGDRVSNQRGSSGTSGIMGSRSGSSGGMSGTADGMSGSRSGGGSSSMGSSSGGASGGGSGGSGGGS